MTLLKRVDGPHVGEHPKAFMAEGGLRVTCPQGHVCVPEDGLAQCAACGWLEEVEVVDGSGT